MTADSTTPINRAACADAIGAAYDHMGFKPPEIMFFDSPMQAFAELQKRAPLPSLEKFQPDKPLTEKDLPDLGNIVMGMLSAAQPREVSALGDEEDLMFTHEMNNAMNPSLPIWEPLVKLVDKQLGDVIHYKHAVDDALEKSITYREHEWLLYSSGQASIWYGAEWFARVQALFSIGLIEALPKEHALGLAVLRNCGWVNSFERLCVVSDRPSAMSQSGRESAPGGLRTQIIWRDGAVCNAVWEG
jgi:hypothetical protein